MSEKIKIICVVGPTASGKTGLGACLARELDGEVISADSMQIYKGMTIASAAPVSYEDTLGIPHHLVEVIEYGGKITVADYLLMARQKISEIALKGKIPIIVGGTGLYISSLVDNIELCEQKTDIELRHKIESRFNELGADAMLEALREIDPKTAARLHPSDKRRIVRAFELYETSGLTITEQNEQSRKKESPYEAVMIGLNFSDRALLYDRINRRVDIMLENDLLAEAECAFKSRVTDGAAQAIGHKELFPYFSGESSLCEVIEDLKRSTRRYAKRQVTWFSRDERINWIYPDKTPDILSEALKIIKEKGSL